MTGDVNHPPQPPPLQLATERRARVHPRERQLRRPRGRGRAALRGRGGSCAPRGAPGGDAEKEASARGGCEQQTRGDEQLHGGAFGRVGDEEAPRSAAQPDDVRGSAMTGRGFTVADCCFAFATFTRFDDARAGLGGRAPCAASWSQRAPGSRFSRDREPGDGAGDGAGAAVRVLGSTQSRRHRTPEVRPASARTRAWVACPTGRVTFGVAAVVVVPDVRAVVRAEPAEGRRARARASHSRSTPRTRRTAGQDRRSSRAPCAWAAETMPHLDISSLPSSSPYAGSLVSVNRQGGRPPAFPAGRFCGCPSPLLLQLASLDRAAHGAPTLVAPRALTADLQRVRAVARLLPGRAPGRSRSG